MTNFLCYRKLLVEFFPQFIWKTGVLLSEQDEFFSESLFYFCVNGQCCGRHFYMCTVSLFLCVFQLNFFYTFSLRVAEDKQNILGTVIAMTRNFFLLLETYSHHFIVSVQDYNYHKCLKFLRHENKKKTDVK